jgi:hypothetical protein
MVVAVAIAAVVKRSARSREATIEATHRLTRMKAPTSLSLSSTMMSEALKLKFSVSHLYVASKLETPQP